MSTLDIYLEHNQADTVKGLINSFPDFFRLKDILANKGLISKEKGVISGPKKLIRLETTSRGIPQRPRVLSIYDLNQDYDSMMRFFRTSLKRLKRNHPNFHLDFNKIPFTPTSTTLLYEFKCETGFLEAVTLYNGDFREPNFRYPERKKRDMFGEGLQYQRKFVEGVYEKANNLCKMVEQMKRRERNYNSSKKSLSDHFLTAFENITSNEMVDKYLEANMEKLYRR